MLICDYADLIQQGFDPLEALLDPWDKSLRPSLFAKELWMLCWHYFTCMWMHKTLLLTFMCGYQDMAVTCFVVNCCNCPLDTAK